MGTPSAVPLISPKLDRMSLRTIPLCSSTSGPLEPSPGYGQAGSSGISQDAVAAVPDAADDADDAGAGAAGDAEDAAPDDEPAELPDPAPQAASPAGAGRSPSN